MPSECFDVLSVLRLATLRVLSAGEHQVKSPRESSRLPRRMQDMSRGGGRQPRKFRTPLPRNARAHQILMLCDIGPSSGVAHVQL